MTPLEHPIAVLIAAVAAIVALTAFLVVRRLTSEGFAVPSVVRITPAKKLTIGIPAGIHSDALQSLQKAYPDNIRLRSAGTGADVSFADGVEAWTAPFRNRMEVITFLPESKVLMMVASLSPAFSTGHVSDMLEAPQIRYVRESHRHAAQQILSTFGVSPPARAWRRVKDAKEATASPAPGVLEVWCAVVLVDPAKPDVHPEAQMQVLDYDDMDANKIKVRLPFASMKAIDLKATFPDASFQQSQVRSVLSVDHLLWQAAPRTSEEARRLTISESVHGGRSIVVSRFNATGFAVNNYYSRYFKLAPDTLTKVRKTNAVIASNVKYDGPPGMFDRVPDDVSHERQIESFSQQQQPGERPIVVKAERELRVFDDGSTNRLRLLEPGCTVSGIRLKAGDRVDMKHQTREIEKGVYTVAPGGACELLRGMSARKMDRVEMGKKEDKSGCMNQPWIKTQHECEGTYFMHKTKPPGVWDYPCSAHTECPYYQANSKYKNYRGGCHSGYCEMPVGVENVGYRFSKGAPYCHGCEAATNDDAMKACCDKNQDYAFPMDQIEREPALRTGGKGGYFS